MSTTKFTVRANGPVAAVMVLHSVRERVPRLHIRCVPACPRRWIVPSGGCDRVPLPVQLSSDKIWGVFPTWVETKRARGIYCTVW